MVEENLEENDDLKHLHCFWNIENVKHFLNALLISFQKTLFTMEKDMLQNLLLGTIIIFCLTISELVKKILNEYI